MIDYIKSWIPRIKNYSLQLDKLSKLYNQPWVVIDEVQDFIKIIFQPDGRLIVSKNGKVNDGSWQMIPIANSILLNISGDKKLYNHQFLDDGLMILKLDGMNNYFVLANQNLIPDLNVEKYLRYNYSSTNPRKVTKVSSTSTDYEKSLELIDGRVLQIIKDLGYMGHTEVRIDHKIPTDGFYRSANRKLAYLIEDGFLQMEYYIERYKQSDGQIIEIGGNRVSGIGKGSPVWLNQNIAPNGRYSKGWFSEINVFGGKLI